MSLSLSPGLEEIIMSLWPACADTQTGTPQRLKCPLSANLGREQHTLRIGGRG